MDITDKTIVITGAAQGLGRSMALMLARQGARLALLDLSEEHVRETAQLCRDAKAQVRTYAADVADEDAVVRAFAQAGADFGPIDGLICNAGTNADALLLKPQDGGMQKMSLADFNKVVAVDLTGVFLCAREGAAQMIASGRGGVLINISSISRAGNVGQGNYAAAKAGVCAMTVTWAQELARYKIRVAAIAPGFSDTQMVARMKPELQNRFRQRIPLQRFAQPEEIADAARFIFENDYFTGRTLELDGGLRL
ncbi:SDR family oxidoreductase [Massilia glaciei]|uniref:KR domain-containing protein n=1 Tax=Massilia glaciei TaxID=1524097 RepID=A0A2U2HHP2_9BURK|nr:SDR family oxidoreductase [Massilia glaciei]PWF45441.1 KR domain-containing protein [Massilia glaciei]